MIKLKKVKKPDGYFPKISIIVSSRRDGNSDSNFRALYESIVEKSNNISNVEILVRVDKDDTGKVTLGDLGFLNSWYISNEESFKIFSESKFRSYEPHHLLQIVKIFEGERNAGRFSMWEFYNSLSTKVSPSSKVLLVFADDIIITLENWDIYIIDIINRINHNYFILSSFKPPIPPTLEELKNNRPGIGMGMDPHKDMSFSPFISTKFFNCMQNWWNNSNDGWIYLLNLYLNIKWKLDLVQLIEPFTVRMGPIPNTGFNSEHELDFTGNWDLDTNRNFDVIWKLIENQSNNIALNYFYETGIDNEFIEKISTS